MIMKYLPMDLKKISLCSENWPAELVKCNLFLRNTNGKKPAKIKGHNFIILRLYQAYWPELHLRHVFTVLFFEGWGGGLEISLLKLGYCSEF